MFDPELGLEWLLHNAPVGLWASTDHAGLRTLAARFPRVAASLILELHLAPAVPAVDFMFAVTRTGLDASMLQRLLDCEASLASCRGSVEAWFSESNLADSPLLWFEWDAVRAFDAAPLCSFGQTAAILGTGQHYRRDEQVTLALASARTLGFANAKLDVALIRCKDALPGNCQLLHVASLRPRHLDRLRITVSLPTEAIPSWLLKVGWPGPMAAAEQLLETLDEPFGRISVQLELAPDVGEYLAVESRERNSQQSGRSLARMFDSLERGGNFDRARAESCLHWPQRVLSPPDLFQAARLEQTLYFKFVLGPRGASQAKAYVGLTPFEQLTSLQSGS